tara:strand:+ start:519 stop:1442 length:924 start_codon:yes stop_codon:yes gene_type:complete
VAIDKIFYNEASAKKLGWDPSWFGKSDFDDDLIVAIKKWQRKHKITADGLCGPNTFRRLWTEREENISDHAPPTAVCGPGDKFIVHNGKFIPIDWDHVILWDDPAGLQCMPGTYTSYAGKPDRKPHFFVNHWDVCLSSESMSRVIAKRGISIHFGIDNDGTIYQLLDTQHAAWQAGGRQWNHDSIGVEIANAFYPKYQNWYVKKGFGARPVREKGEVQCHGRDLQEHLGFYDVQIEALKALWVAIHRGLNIPLECPTNNDGSLIETVHRDCENSKFSGFINHYNLTRRKIDCAGLDLVCHLNEIKQS